MGNEDFRRELNAVFDGIAGSPSPALSDRVRSAVANPPQTRGRYWVAAVAAVVIVAVLISALVLANPLRRSNGPVGVGQPSPSATPTSTPSAAPFECGVNYGPITQSGPTIATVSDVRTGTHPGYDRITITFSNGAPRSFEVKSLSSATFTQEASGQTVVLRGDSGLLVIIVGADGHTAYSGPTDFKTTGYPKLLEARQVGDFEGTVQWGLGVAGSACYRVLQFTNPDRLVIDVQTAG